VRFVNQVAKACNLPLIGCGGVMSAEDVIELMMAGATAVQVGSANLHDPLACPAIIDALPSVMERLGIERLEDIIGIV
jgi:dihydroorotate dehydrogenase (NAD+) catalytic subunit